MKQIYCILISFSFFLFPLVAYSGIEGDAVVCSGETYTYEVYDENGGIGAGTYRWYINGARIFAGEYTADITFPSDRTEHLIEVYYDNGTGDEVKYTKTIYSYNGGNASISSSMVCSGGSVTLEVWGQNGSADYTWERKPEGGSWSSLTNGNTEVLYSDVSLKTFFRYKVNSPCGFLYSNEVEVDVYPALEAGSIVQAPMTICYNSSPGQLEASSATGGGGGYEYQWELSTDDQSWTEIAGATNSSFTPDQLTQTTYFRQKVSALCGTEETTSIEITVREELEAGSIGGAKTVYCGSTAGAIEEVSSPAGGTQVYEYQWVKSLDQLNWEPIPDQGEANCSPPAALQQTTYYKRLVTSGNCGTVESNIVEVVVEALPVAETSDESRCGEGQITLNATPGTNGVTCRWYDSSGNLLATDLSYTTPHLSADSTTYYVSSYHPFSDCESEQVPVVATVKSLPSKPVLVATQDRIGSGEAAIELNGVPAGGEYRLYTVNGTYLGYSSSGNFTVEVAEPTANSSVTHYYYASAVVAGCESSEKVEIPVNVYEPPVISSANGSKIYLNEAVQLFTAGGFDTYQWKKDGESISAATTNSLLAPSPGSFTLSVSLAGAGSYTTAAFVVENGELSDQPTDLNYIETNSLLVPNIQAAGEIGNLSVEERTQQIQYFDGLGRMVQVVTTQASPAKKDLVQPLQYNAFGREWRKYLPYAGEEHSGFYKADAVETPETYESSKQYAFYQSADKVAHDAFPYAEAVFEASPLHRVVEQGAPGAAWQPENGHTVKLGFKVNAVEDRIIVWKYIPAGHVFGGVVASGYYPGGRLYIKVSEDEEGNQVKEYTNKLGQVVLKEVLDEQEVSHFTYYVYDDFGNLRVVLPPAFMDAWEEGGGVVQDPSQYEGYQVVNQARTINDTTDGTKYYLRREARLTMSMGFSSGPDFHALVEGEPVYLEAAILNNYVFYYHYDGRQRMVEKHVPGGGLTYMVYDPWDRLVLTQDAEQRETNQWLYTKYDALNRPVVTGLWTDSEGRERADLQQALADGVEAETFARSEDRDHSEAHGYSLDKSFPTSVTAGEVLTVSFFDNYDFKFSPAEALTIAEEEEGLYSYTVPEGFEDKRFDRIQGQVTGTKIRVLGSDSLLNAVSYYDDKYRLIQSITDNQQEGTDRFSSAYDFTGKVTQSLLQHQGSAGVTIRKEFIYDHAGRLLQTWQTIGGNEEDKTLLAENEYNALGELVDKKLHSKDEGGSFLQSVDYRYNIRGWLTSINKSSLVADDSNDDTDDFFGMELGYIHDFGLGAERVYHNGNITAIKWSANLGLDTTDNQRAYTYGYDGLNRIKTAAYKKKGAAWAGQEAYRLSGIAYDKNGNLQNLSRKGADGSDMDILTYAYENGGNQLTGVSDASANEAGFKDGNTSGNDYRYDENGNLIEDKNKGISDIRYNHLNLPEEVLFADGNKITYTYDAAGIKLSQLVEKEGEEPKLTEYIAGMVYEDGVLQFIQHEEGRVVYNSGEANPMEYQYHLKDHLGNVRMSFTSRDKVDEATATMETAHEEEEWSEFLHYEEVTKINTQLFDHTDEGGTYYSMRLSGAEGERIGLAKSLAVKPGDVVSAQVFAKYLDPETGNWSEALANLMAGIAGGTAAAGTIVDGAGISQEDFGFAGMLSKGEDGEGVKAYLNVVIVDKNFNFLDGGYEAVGTEAKENGSNVPHQQLSWQDTITQPGFVYIWLSNENEQPVEVYFDDFTVTHEHSKVIQADDYYPFGLTHAGSSYTAGERNKYLYNGLAPY